MLTAIMHRSGQFQVCSHWHVSHHNWTNAQIRQVLECWGISQAYRSFRVYSILDFIAGLKNMQVCCQADAMSLSPLVSNVIYVMMLKLQKFSNCICSYVTPTEIQVFCISLWAFNYSSTGL